MLWCLKQFCFFFQAEDGIRDAQESRGLGDVYKRQKHYYLLGRVDDTAARTRLLLALEAIIRNEATAGYCLLYTSDAADDLPCVDLGGRHLIKKKTQ